jgi:hypothetical protein
MYGHKQRYHEAILLSSTFQHQGTYKLLVGLLKQRNSTVQDMDEVTIKHQVCNMTLTDTKH